MGGDKRGGRTKEIRTIKDQIFILQCLEAYHLISALCKKEEIE